MRNNLLALRRLIYHYRNFPILNSMMKKIKNILKNLKDSFSGFFDDRGLKLSASLAYYTVFSLPSLLFMLIGLGALIFGKDAIQGEIFGSIKGVVGPEAAKDIEQMLQKTSINKTNIWATIIGGILLIFTATGVFAEIQDSINFIWGLRPKPKKGLMSLVINRLISFSMILVLGFILMVSLMLSAILATFTEKIKAILSDNIVNLFFIFDYAVMLVVICSLFAAIFKLLPDAKIKFKEVLPGAIFTSILFFIGKYAISFYLEKYGNVKVYGPASSLILIILWVYYSAIILYLGAEFTKYFMINNGRKIIPLKFAELVEDPLNRKVEEKGTEQTNAKLREEENKKATRKKYPKGGGK